MINKNVYIFPDKLINLNGIKEEKKRLNEQESDEVVSKIIDGVEKRKYVLIKYYIDGVYKFHSGYIKYINDCIIFNDGLSILKDDIIEAFLV